MIQESLFVYFYGTKINCSIHYFQSNTYMRKVLLAIVILFLSFLKVNAQLGAIKLVGKNTKDYTLGFGAFIRSGFPVSDGSTATLELGADIFPLNDGNGGDGTIMCPLKVGYRYTIDHTGTGFYVEPQVGYDLIGVTSLYDKNDTPQDLRYHGAVLAIGTGYLFTALHAPFDLNLRYETVVAHGGSNNLISLGISRFISFRKRESE